ARHAHRWRGDHRIHLCPARCGPPGGGCSVRAGLSARPGRGAADHRRVHRQQPARRHCLRLARSADSLRMTRQHRWLFVRRALSARFALFGVIVVIGVLLMAVSAPLISPYDPIKQDLSAALATPSLTHLLGTDNNGRDVLTRVIWGTRISLIAGLTSVAIGVMAGCLLGLAAGYWGGPIDDALMRLVDALLSFPALVLALAFGA